MSDYSTQKSQKMAKNPTKESGNPLNSRSNSFLRSLKSSKPYKSSETELEEGETISPSPSPRHTSIKVPTDKPRETTTTTTTRREPIKEKERSPSRHTNSNNNNNNSRRREDAKRSNARQQDYRSSRHESDNESASKRRSSVDRKRDNKGYRSSRYHSRSRSTSRSRSPPQRRSRNRSSDTRSNRSESSRRRSSPPPPTSTTTTTTTSRSEKSITNGNSKNPDTDNNKRKRSPPPREKRDSSIEKSGTMLTPTSHVKETTKPTKTISATAPDSDTPEQCKLFIIMFSKLAHANKRRGDHQTEEFFGMIDHFHALCDYILNFYYVDKTSVDKVSFKQASQAWKSLFPFTDSLLAKLESHQHYDLYGLCARLISLVRYYIYKRMIDQTRHLLGKQLAQDDDKDSSSSRVCIQVSEGLLREYEKAERWYRTSEKYLSYGTMATQFPETFKHVCIEGDLSAGITLGGEAGVSVEPMFPFTPYSPLHHAAIVSKCMLSEYVRAKKFNYTPISQPEEYMK